MSYLVTDLTTNNIKSLTLFNMEYTDKILIKLKRKYSKDETVAALVKKLKEAETENGKLSAEIAHLEYKLAGDINKQEENKLARIEARKNKLFQDLTSQNKKMRKQIKELRELRNQLFSKLNKFERENK